MSDKENQDDVTESSTETNTEQVIEAAAATVPPDKTASESDTKTNKFNNDVLTRILVTLLFALIGWVSLWVFAVVVLVQFGFFTQQYIFI